MIFFLFRNLLLTKAIDAVKLFQRILLIGLTLFLFSCASEVNVTECVNLEEQKGFFFGLLHGFLAPLTFIIGIFSDTITMYEVNNAGGWYDFGFLLGIGGFSGGIFKSTKKK